MDKKDEIILNTLLRNGRASMAAIAQKIKISETAVRKRIKKLERIGAIKAYTALIDPFFAGFFGVALVGIDTAPNKLLKIFDIIKDMENVRYCALTTGDHMMMFEIWCKTTKELEKILHEIEKMEGVTKVCPAVMLKRVE